MNVDVCMKTFRIINNTIIPIMIEVYARRQLITSLKLESGDESSIIDPNLCCSGELTFCVTNLMTCRRSSVYSMEPYIYSPSSGMSDLNMHLMYAQNEFVMAGDKFSPAGNMILANTSSNPRVSFTVYSARVGGIIYTSPLVSDQIRVDIDGILKTNTDTLTVTAIPEGGTAITAVATTNFLRGTAYAASYILEDYSTGSLQFYRLA